MIALTVFGLAALPFGLAVVLYLALALILAFATFEAFLGWSLFRYTTQRATRSGFTPPADLPEETLDWYRSAAVARERLLLRPYEEWEIRRDHLTLKARYFPAREGEGTGRRPCALVVHGWRDTAMSRALDVQMYLDGGYSVLVPFLRGHEPSGGRRIDIGLKHRKDLFAWMEEVRRRSKAGEPDFFVLDGLSMGASTVLTAAGDPDLPRDVAAVLADCGYTAPMDQGRWMVRGMKPLMRYPAFFFTRLFFFLLMGYTKKDPTPRTQVARASVPVFFIHGSEDLFVPAAMARELYEACTSPVKELWYVEGAKHAMSFAVAGDQYRVRKMAFIDRALAGRQSEG